MVFKEFEKFLEEELTAEIKPVHKGVRMTVGR